MRYFWTFFWTFLLSHMLTYVVGSMSGSTYDFATGTYLAVAITIFIVLIPAILPKDEQVQ